MDALLLAADGYPSWISDLRHVLRSLPVPVELPNGTPTADDVDAVRKAVRAACETWLGGLTVEHSSRLPLIQGRLERDEGGNFVQMPLKLRQYFRVPVPAHRKALMRATLKAQIQRERATASAITKPQPRTSLVASINRSAFRNRNHGKAAAAPVRVKLEPTADGLSMEGIARPSTVSFQGPSTSASARKKRAYRYMHEKPSERGDMLDDRIDEFAERIRQHYDLSDLGDPSSSTSDDSDVTVVGRVVQDDDAAEDSAKLADGAIALESSRSMGNGVRVPLRFHANLKICGGAQGSGSGIFFSGAIAALRGKNGGGGYFQIYLFRMRLSLTIYPSMAVEAKNLKIGRTTRICGVTTDLTISREQGGRLLLQFCLTEAREGNLEKGACRCKDAEKVTHVLATPTFPLLGFLLLPPHTSLIILVHTLQEPQKIRKAHHNRATSDHRKIGRRAQEP
ncbi:hypothetical protein B0H11DRAFT_2343456 [Mycena galericulata]|nr:hypothetical protein B0H11DRAFT_2343456 [Mycena galericulata]